MELTKTDIVQIVNWGEAEHSQVALDFMAEVKKQLGIDIVACYCDSGQEVLFDDPSCATQVIDPANARLVNLLFINMYLRGFGNPDDLIKRYNDDILRIFKNAVAANGEQIDYPRFYSPEETRYYGWNKSVKGKCDMSKVIRPAGPATDKCYISAESFDSLALWHYLSREMKNFNALPEVIAVCGNIYYGWSQRYDRPAAFVILPESRFHSITANEKKAIIAEFLKHLHVIDKCNIVRADEFLTVFTTWDALSDEQKFAFARDCPRR